ncbi:BMP family ABC transporter substrate-binding protein [Mycoplasmoides pneumoniae]|uniref:BMP family ABC transporter substrate-binding protein n=2 Tax=Mycoplasmoides pneumoniae TaxID=2104 RepID=UPI00132F7643|nr:BMP family ABC transporter substrate-binding protein [Mycoplasmoides pneumoniae]
MFGKGLVKKGLLFFSGVSTMAVFLVSCGATRIWESSIQLLVSNDEATLADKSFSEMSYEGIRRYFRSQKHIELPSPNSSLLQDGNGLWKRPGRTLSDRIATFKNIKNDGSDVIVATGFNQQEALQAISSDDRRYLADKNDLAKVGFIFVDGQIEKEYNVINKTPQFRSTPLNISSVAFRSDDGSFLTGVATAVYLNLNQDYFLKKNGATNNSSQDLNVSGFVGVPIPSTLSFLNGFRLGIAYFNEVIYTHLSDAETTSDNKSNSSSASNSVLVQLKQMQGNDKKIKKIKWISPKQGSDNNSNLSIDDHKSGSFSSTEPRATTIINNLLDKGVSAIIPVAGPQVNLAVNEVARRKAHTAIIGVDSAQELLDINQDAPDKDQLIKGNKKIIPFSSIKALDVAIENMLIAIQKGSDNNGYKGFGYNNIGTVGTSSVGISEAGYEFLIDPVFWKTTQSQGKSMATNMTNLKRLSSDDTNTKKALKEVSTHKNGSDKDGIIGKYSNLLTKKSTTVTAVAQKSMTDNNSGTEQKKNLSEVDTKKKEKESKGKTQSNGQDSGQQNGKETNDIISKYSKLLTMTTMNNKVMSSKKQSSDDNSFKKTSENGDWVIKGDELTKKKSTELPAFAKGADYPTFPTEAVSVINGSTALDGKGFKWSFKQI